MKKFKALVTAEVDKELLEKNLSDKVEFIYAGYNIDHNVLGHQTLIKMVKNVDILICEYDTISRDVFDNADKLKIIICCRGGVKSVVDLECAMEKGVIVCNNVGRNASAVTDMAMGYIIDLTRNITLTNNLIQSKVITEESSTKPKEYKDTVWGLDSNSPFIKYRGRSINHMTLGLVGYGCAGRLLAKKASAFGMKILAYDPYCNFEEKPEFVTPVSWDNLLASSDVISVHCTFTPQTKGMFCKKIFEQMKDKSYFINTSRGEVVVEEDLVWALKSGKLSGAALDVTAKEPISSNSNLIGVENLIITPHIAGSSDDVQYCGTCMAVQSLVDYFNGEKPKNAIVYR